jgi:bifunctional non-homologous end joining protein LigD
MLRNEIWDSGTYENLKEKKKRGEGYATMDSSIRSGQIEVDLKGKKLKGPYALVRTNFGGKKKNWLLIKMKRR